MSLRLRQNDLTSHGGWYFLLRSCDQQPMTLDVKRGESEFYSFCIREGFVCDGHHRICTVKLVDGAYVIDDPSSLITFVLTPQSDRFPKIEQSDVLPEAA